LNWSVHTMSAIGADILKLYKVWCAWIFNTDQGSQYTSEVHTNVLLNNGIKNYMDGKGRVDNIFYWKIMEDSQIRECIFTSIYWRNQPYRGLKDYFEYCTHPTHQSLISKVNLLLLLSQRSGIKSE
jgi:putative transposase